MRDLLREDGKDSIQGLTSYVVLFLLPYSQGQAVLLPISGQLIPAEKG